MVNKTIFILLLFLSAAMAYTWEINDINGTFVYVKEHLHSSNIYKKNFSWGEGKRIPNTTINFDVGENTIIIPGMGLYNIATVCKDKEGSISLVLFYVSDTKHEHPINMKVTFIDYNRVYIILDCWQEWSDRTYSPEAKWIWYRLSGPKKD